MIDLLNEVQNFESKKWNIDSWLVLVEEKKVQIEQMKSAISILENDIKNIENWIDKIKSEKDFIFEKVLLLYWEQKKIKWDSEHERRLKIVEMKMWFIS